MRGNHILWGRDDIIEPPSVGAQPLARIAQCIIAPRDAGKTACHNWHAVHVAGQLIGYVKTGSLGQQWRTPEMIDWVVAATAWHIADPIHSLAILALLDHHETMGHYQPLAAA